MCLQRLLTVIGLEVCRSCRLLLLDFLLKCFSCAHFTLFLVFFSIGGGTAAGGRKQLTFRFNAHNNATRIS
jgi:hypothetical protein